MAGRLPLSGDAGIDAEQARIVSKRRIVDARPAALKAAGLAQTARTLTFGSSVVPSVRTLPANSPAVWIERGGEIATVDLFGLRAHGDVLESPPTVLPTGTAN